MCRTCGCSGGHRHSHDHDHGNEHGHDHEHGPDGQRIEVERRVLERNDQCAARNRARLAERRLPAINLLSSPGSGKTALLERTLRDLKGGLRMAVVVGDQQTRHDADRLAATGAPALQINTLDACHLNAEQVSGALDALDLDALDLLFIENVGNLVCPASFDLGETLKATLLSVTEGEDKPEKYPLAFHVADIVLITKIDLAQAVEFDEARALSAIRQVNPRAPVVKLSAKTGKGMAAWFDFLHGWT